MDAAELQKLEIIEVDHETHKAARVFFVQSIKLLIIFWSSNLY